MKKYLAFGFLRLGVILVLLTVTAVAFVKKLLLFPHVAYFNLALVYAAYLDAFTETVRRLGYSIVIRKRIKEARVAGLQALLKVELILVAYALLVFFLNFTILCLFIILLTILVFKHISEVPEPIPKDTPVAVVVDEEKRHPLIQFMLYLTSSLIPLGTVMFALVNQVVGIVLATVGVVSLIKAVF